jgi:hypothetical protein
MESEVNDDMPPNRSGATGPVDALGSDATAAGPPPTAAAEAFGHSSNQSKPVDNLPLPDKVTMAWLWGNVPAQFWISLMGVLVTAFVAGFTLGQMPAVGQLLHPKEPQPLPQPSDSTQRADGKRTAPSEMGIVLVPPATQSQWLNALVTGLNLDGANKKRVRPELHYDARAVEHLMTNASSSFDWLLKAHPDFDITGYAYRVIKDGLIQPLSRESAEGGDWISFKVPECEAGDRLVAVVLVTWKQSQAVPDVLWTFDSKTK